MNNIIKHYNEKISEVNKQNLNFELEITYNLYKSFDLYKDIFNKLKDLSDNITIVENIDIYYDNNIRVTKNFKQGINQNDDSIIAKTSLLKPFNFKDSIENVSNYKLKLNSEEQLTKHTKLKSIKLIRLKLRLSFILKNNSDYTIDLDLIKNKNVNEKNIKEIKNILFKPYQVSNIIENINYSLFDNILLETEFINDIISNDTINNSINFVKSLLVDNMNIEYQGYIYKIAKYIISNKAYLENFKHKSGLKKLLNNVLELNSEYYYKNIIPSIENYYVTDKIDGQRCICYIEECDNLLNIKLITNKMYQIEEYNEQFILTNTNEIKITILDCEMILEESKKESNIISEHDIFLYIFDIITLENNKIALKPFEDRFVNLESGFNKIKHLSNVHVKEYVKLTSEYKKELHDFYKKKQNNKKYEIDGLIFIPNSKVSNTQSKFPINSNYNNMVGYKWKPIEHMTIDFYICQLPKNLYDTMPYHDLKLKKTDNIYILFSGISKFDFEKLHLTFMDNYQKIVNEKFLQNNMFPIQFSPSDNPYNYIYVSSNDELHNRIGEFNYDTKNNKWAFKKIRTDRDIELERGEYFGNYFKISELIWNNINNPLTFDMLISDNNSYFMSDNNDFYKAQRSYNSFVKTHVLETILSTKLIDKNLTNSVIDLAAGKGQDLARLTNLGFKQGLFIDNDKNALLELINRKYNLKTMNNKSMKTYVKNIDLTQNYLEIIKTLDVFDLKKESVDVIICNFAIHYIISNESNLMNLIQLLNHYLKPNGRFIFTCFNGEKIYNLLENSDIWNLYENNNLKYSIKKLYKSKKFENTGQKIDVLLPFSNGTYYTEYLMNLDYILNIFDKNNLLPEVSLPFNNLLDEFKTKNNKIYNQLSESDKEYIGLYQFNIIKKKQLNDIIIKTNINDLFNSNSIIGSNANNIMENNGNMNELKNINNSKKILLIVNTNIPNIINNILDIFIEKNYKNMNTKSNKYILQNDSGTVLDMDFNASNKLIKIVGFKEPYTFNKMYDEYKKLNFDSIILYDYKFNHNESINSALIKNANIPIVLFDNDDNNIFILDNDLLKLIDTNDILEYIYKNNIQYISNK